MKTAAADSTHDGTFRRLLWAELAWICHDESLSGVNKRCERDRERA